MTPLPSQSIVPLGEDETPTSFCSRLGLMVRRTARDFSLDMGVQFQAIVDGNQAAIESLARRGRADPAELLSSALVKIGDRRHTLKHEHFVRDALSRKTVRACPRCIVEDLETSGIPRHVRPFGRASWLIASIRTCERHGVALETVSDSLSQMHDFGAAIQPILNKADRLERDALRRPPSPFERYILGRLRKTTLTAPNWLDGMPLYAAAKTCEIVGAIACRGARFRSDEMLDADWHEAGGIGFEIAAPGENNIRGFLHDLRVGWEAQRGDWGPRKLYGRLHEWLSHESQDPAYNPLRDIMFRHIVETLPVGPGEAFFGRQVGTRRLHSVRSAQQEFGLHPKRLKKMLHAKGFIDRDAMDRADERIVFDAAATESFLGQVSRSLNLREVRGYLNVPRPMEQTLLDAGFIKPFLVGGTEVFKDHAFDSRDLDGFLERLMEGAVNVEPESGLVSIQTASKKLVCPALDIVRLLLDRRLTLIGRDPGERAFASIRVDLTEVARLIRPVESTSLSLREVERMLHSSTNVVKALIEHGHLTADVVVNPVTRLQQRVVEPKDLDNFMSRFVSLHELAREAGIHHLEAKGLLLHRGIEPAFDPVEIRASFYPRDDAERAVGKLVPA